jgi:uncharacterized phage protein (TIGR02218 family)
MRTAVLTAFKTYLTTKIGKTLARCIRINTVFGVTYAFTSHTRDLTIGEDVYLSLQGFQISDVRFSEFLVPGTLTVSAFLYPDFESAVINGFLDNAAVDVFTINYMNLNLGKIIESTGRVGEITRMDGLIQVEVRGLAQVLDTKIGRIFSPSCDADLGDSRCRVQIFPISNSMPCTVAGSPTNSITRNDGGSFLEDGYTLGSVVVVSGSLTANNVSATISSITSSVIVLSATLTNESSITLTIVQSTNFWQRGTVTSTSTDRKVIQTSTSFESGFANQGRIIFKSGENDRIHRDIRFNNSGLIQTYLPFPSLPQSGDIIEVTAGCDKKASTCKNKFNNKINFRGFDFVPTNEAVFYNPSVGKLEDQEFYTPPN